MPKKKNNEEKDPAELPPVNAGELEVLAVFWAQEQRDPRPLSLSEVFRRVCERRQTFADPDPALTTVSTHLRNLRSKKLLNEVETPRAKDGVSPSRISAQSRGSYTPRTRSPLTGYQVVFGPGQVLRSTLHGMASAYPANHRFHILLDLANILKLSPEGRVELEKLVQAEYARDRV